MNDLPLILLYVTLYTMLSQLNKCKKIPALLPFLHVDLQIASALENILRKFAFTNYVVCHINVAAQLKCIILCILKKCICQ